MDKLAESKVREILGDGKLYQVTTGGDEFLYEIEQKKEYLELIESWNSFCSNLKIGEVSDKAQESAIISEIKSIFGEDCTILAYSRAGSSYDFHKDEVILWQSSPDKYGKSSVDTDKTAHYLVCKKGKKKLNIEPYIVEEEDTRIYLYNKN